MAVLGYLFFLFVGLAMLIWGGESLVNGATRLSRRIGISTMVIGLTVVAFGTSVPEFVVSALASFKDQGSVAVGNIIGSNIANIALILGISALIRPIKIKKRTLRREIPWMLFSTLLFFATAFFSRISRIWAVVFLLAFSVFLFSCFKTGQETGDEETQEKAQGAMGKALFRLIFGLTLLFVGGEVVVNNAVALAELLNISQLFIGIAIIAVGTSLPELITGIVASVKNEQDIAVGNVVGSNIFNILWVLGASALIRPLAMGKEILIFHMPVLIFFSVICIPIMRTGFTISRKEGVFLLLGYGTYIAVLATFFLR